jgi:uncharacterized protein YlaI
MKHYTCDLCGRPISEERYTARIEIAAAFDPDTLPVASPDDDSLEQIADEIEALDDTGQFDLPETGPRQFEFDLCPACQRRLVRDPLNRAAKKQLNFSPN